MRGSRTAVTDVTAVTNQQIWEIDLLGPVRARRGDQTVSEFGTKQATRLLAYLAYQGSSEAGGNYGEYQLDLAEMFWPNPMEKRVNAKRQVPDRQLHSLDQAISKIRKSLAVTSGPAIEVIVKYAKNDTVGLAGEAIRTDVQRLMKLREEARRNADGEERARQAQCLLDAAMLFRGIPFLGFPEPEFVGWRGDLIDALCNVIRELSVLVPSSLGPASLAPHFERSVEMARYQGKKTGEFIAEPYVAAIQMYQRLPMASEQTRKWCRRLEADHCSVSILGCGPNEPVETYGGLPPGLEEVTRVARSLAGGVTVTGANVFTPLTGSARLPPQSDEIPRDVVSILRILKSSVPELRSRLFGRGQELAVLSDLIFDSEDGVPEGGLTSLRARAVTIIGEGGIGKSKLAEEAASVFQPLLQNRVGIVRLQSVTQSRHLLLEIAAFLAVSVPPEDDANAVADAIAERIGAGPLLLVLDNMEHLLGHGPDENGAGETVRQLTILLGKCPGLGLLMTSRQPIGIAREQVLRLKPLKVPAGVPQDGSRSDGGDVESVQLFLDRYLTVGVTWEGLEPKEREAVVEICWRMEGVPLSLELLARHRYLKPSQILSLVRQRRYDILTSDDGQTEDRRKSVFDSIDISFRLLSPQVRAFFLRLAVFGGSFAAESAAAVAGDPLAGERLANLLNKSLILSEPVESSGDGGIRYRFRDTIRAFAENRLSQQAGESRRAAAAHTRYFKQWVPFRENESREDWQRRIAADYGNIEAALKRGLESGRDGAVEALAIAAAIVPFWFVQGRHREGIRWIEAILKGDHGLDLEAPDDMLATLFNGNGAMNGTLGNNERAEESFLTSARMYASLGNRLKCARAWNGLGNVASNRAAYGRSIGYYAEAAGIYREMPVDQAQEEMAVTLCNWGNTLKEAGDLAGAEEKYLECLSELNQLETRNPGQRRLVEKARVYDGFGNIAVSRGDFLAAIGWYEQAYRDYDAAEPKAHLQMATSLHNLGCAYFSLNDLFKSRRYFEEAVKIRRAGGEELLLSTSLHHLAAIERLQDHVDSAADCLDEALRLAGSPRMEAKNTVVYILLELCRFAAWRGHFGAEKLIRSVSDLAQKEWDIRVEKDRVSEANEEGRLPPPTVPPRADITFPRVPSCRGGDAAVTVAAWGLTVLSLIRPYGGDRAV